MVPSRHDGTTVDWHVKPEKKKKKKKKKKRGHVYDISKEQLFKATIM